MPVCYLGKTPVTNAQYREFVRVTGHEAPQGWSNGIPPPDKEDHPVLDVSWYGARGYCQWLSQVTGKDYRLPSEAEWEKGARGTDGRIYPWGNRWYGKRCNLGESVLNRNISVFAYPSGASPYGALDMAGNVWEWTRSLQGKSAERLDYWYPYRLTDGRENPDAGRGELRMLRGGAFDANRWIVRCAYRYRLGPAYRGGSVGFRVVGVRPAS